jgi:hypothetical protein
VRRGDEWIDGQVLADLARIAGVNLHTQTLLKPADLAARVDMILSAAHVTSAPELVGFVHQVQERFDEWWKRDGAKIDFSATANV